jgi:hypothetical protein
VFSSHYPSTSCKVCVDMLARIIACVNSHTTAQISGRTRWHRQTTVEHFHDTCDTLQLGSCFVVPTGDPPAGLGLSGSVGRSTDRRRVLAIAEWRKNSNMTDVIRIYTTQTSYRIRNPYKMWFSFYPKMTDPCLKRKYKLG